MFSDVSQEQLADSTLEVLHDFEARRLMQYFANHLEIIRNVPQVISTLQKFPYYKTVRDKLVSLENTYGYIIPHEIPTEDMDCWENTTGKIFLKSDDSLNGLYKFLGCTSLTEVEVYCSFILIQEYFEMMTECGRNVHMKYIKNILLPKLESDKEEHLSKALIDMLMELRFIPGPDKKLQRACYFYNPNHAVFRAIKNEESFPPAEFREMGWLDFLEKIGMVNDVTVDMFLEFANTVAADATQDPGNKNTARQSKVLVEFLIDELRNQGSEWHEQNFIRKISMINFIVPHRVEKCLTKLHSQFRERKIDGELLYARYRDSFISSKIVDQLTWSSSVIIPAWAEPKHPTSDIKNSLMMSLGVSKTPTLDAVLDHLVSFSQCMEQKVDREMPRSDLLFGVLRNIYNFLNDRKSEHEAMRKRLDTVKFLAVENGTQLVYARQVAVDILPEDEICPHFFKLPHELGEFVNLFVNLGVSRKATAEQYAQVLDEIPCTDRE